MNYFNRANDYYNSKDYNSAIEMYKKSSTNQQNEPACLYNSAVCFIKLQQYNKAIPLLKSAINLKKQSIYFFNLAYCYAMEKDYKKALIHFNIAWSLDETDKDCEKAINLITRNLKK